ncbi:MAG: prolipoprotein diacylglyceryl transferase [Candidatus Polarisedimenticolia bacterium]
MMPVLFELHLFGWDLSLPTYGTLLAAAFLAALWMSIRLARRVDMDTTLVTDVWITSLIAGVLGSKLLLILLDLPDYIAHPWALVTSLRSAGVFYGGLIAAIVACLVLVRRRGVNGWVVADVVAPAIMLGQAVGRWGCFAAGCCWGTSTSLPWAVTFTNPKAHDITGVPLNVPLHPVQIYLSLADLAAFFILLWINARRKFTGQVILSYLILYALLRGVLEAFRGDPRGEVAGLSTSQVISIIVGVVALVLYIWRSRQPGAAVTSSSVPDRPRGGGKRRKEAPAP